MLRGIFCQSIFLLHSGSPCVSSINHSSLREPNFFTVKISLHFDALKFILLWKSSENMLMSYLFLTSFRLFKIFTVWNVKNLEKLFVLCWQIYFSGFLSTLFQQFTAFLQKLTFKAITLVSQHSPFSQQTLS